VRAVFRHQSAAIHKIRLLLPNNVFFPLHHEMRAGINPHLWNDACSGAVFVIIGKVCDGAALYVLENMAGSMWISNRSAISSLSLVSVKRPHILKFMSF